MKSVVVALVAVQWALADQGPDDGGFVCVPGSHRANFPVPADANPGLVVRVPMRAGDVVFFTEGLTHGTAPWQAAHDRRALLYKYAPGHSCWGIQYTTTPDADTHSHSGSVTRATARCASNRPRQARPTVSRTSGTMATARTVWLIRIVK